MASGRAQRVRPVVGRRGAWACTVLRVGGRVEQWSSETVMVYSDGMRYHGMWM